MRRQPLPVMVLPMIVLLGALALAGCGSGNSGSQSISSLGLVKAQYSTCSRQGGTLASYLSTGKPTSDDPEFGDQRMQALSMNGQKRDLYVRLQADSVIQQCDQDKAQAHEQAVAQEAAKKRATLAAQTCRTAKGRMTSNINGSVCVVAGVQDPVESVGAPQGLFAFPPNYADTLRSQCSAISGHWISDPGGGYVLDNAGWDCVLGKTKSVWDLGFEDAVTSFGSLSWVVPIKELPAMNALDTQCTAAEGDFGLDTDKTATTFACLLNGTTEDDVLLAPSPRYSKAL